MPGRHDFVTARGGGLVPAIAEPRSFRIGSEGIPTLEAAEGVKELRCTRGSSGDFPDLIAQAETRVLEESGWNLDRIFSTDDMAASPACPPSRLQAMLLVETGLSPAAYHLYARLSRGLELLEIKDLHIQQLAAELGFSSAIHFSTAFRKYAGKSPRHFRQSREQIHGVI